MYFDRLLKFRFYFFKVLFIYLNERESTHTSRGNSRGRSRLPTKLREPNTGLEPGGSRPEPKADA